MAQSWFMTLAVVGVIDWMCSNFGSRVTRRSLDGTLQYSTHVTRVRFVTSVWMKNKSVSTEVWFVLKRLSTSGRDVCQRAGCIAPFERLIHKDSTPLVRIILYSRGTLHKVDGGRKRCAGDSNTSHSCSLLLTAYVESHINCHFTVLSALCSAGLLLWYEVLSSLSCGQTAWDLSLFLIPHLGWTFICFLWLRTPSLRYDLWDC